MSLVARYIIIKMAAKNFSFKSHKYSPCTLYRSMSFQSFRFISKEKGRLLFAVQLQVAKKQAVWRTNSNKVSLILSDLIGQQRVLLNDFEMKLKMLKSHPSAFVWLIYDFYWAAKSTFKWHGGGRELTLTIWTAP